VLKVENQVEISLDQSGLYMKATVCICFQFRAHTHWYKNLLIDSTLKISVNGEEEIPSRGKPITDSNSVDDIVKKFKSKYGEGDVKKYYPKVDIAVQVPL
jgi:hypothetical protein